MIVSDTIWPPDLSKAGKSKYKALAQAIRDAIVAGHLTQSEKLPPVRELAYRIGVTPGTVARAYAVLTEEGRLVAEVGRGTFVAETRLPKMPAVTPLINLPVDTVADFRSSRVPDVGQGVLIDEALARLAQAHRRRHINYPTAETDLGAREAVADWLDPVRLGGVTAQDIVLACGAQNASIIALQAELRGQTPVILSEELAYPGVRHAARLLRAELVGLPMDADGVRPDALEQAYRTYGGQVFMTAAEVHSPTTTRTSLARKQEIARVARSLNITIIEDDCHTVHATDIPSYRAILPDQSYYVSSLTKSVGGALRFGYAVAPVGQDKVLRQVAQSSFYGLAQPILDLCEDLLRSGVAAEIRSRVVTETARRVRTTLNALGAWDMRWREDAPFVFLQMPQGWRASRFAMECEKRSILVKPADEFALSDGRAPNAVRLGLNTCNVEPLFVSALRDMNTMLANPLTVVEN